MVQPLKSILVILTMKKTPFFYRISTVTDSVPTQCLVHNLTIQETKGTEDFVCLVLCPKLSSMSCIVRGFSGLVLQVLAKSLRLLQPSQLLSSQKQVPGSALVSEFLGVCELSPQDAQRCYEHCEISDAGCCGMAGTFGLTCSCTA